MSSYETDFGSPSLPAYVKKRWISAKRYPRPRMHSAPL